MTDEIEIEVLQHGGNHHENHVLSHKGKGQMRPSEVIVLYVEVLFACSTLIIKCNDVFLGRHPVIGEDTAVCVYSPKISVCCLPSLSFKGLRCTISLYNFPSIKLSMLTEVTSHFS